MTQTCGSNSQCTGFANLYGGAVQVFGEDAYTEAGLVQQCREFKEDMKENCDGYEGAGGTSGT